MLTDDEIRTLWTALDAQPIETAAAFKLQLITAQRGSEVIDMRWADVDLDAALWTIPAARTKRQQPHRVPLSSMAVEIIEALRAAADARTGEPEFVMVEARGTRQRTEAVSTFGLKKVVGHDLRRTAASRMAGADVSPLPISKVLNHDERGALPVYGWHNDDGEKRAALETWEALLTSIAARSHARQIGGA